MANAFRVAIIHDYSLFRDGVISMLTRANDFEVVGQGATAADGLKIAQELLPDVVLLNRRIFRKSAPVRKQGRAAPRRRQPSR